MAGSNQFTETISITSSRQVRPSATNFWLLPTNQRVHIPSCALKMGNEVYKCVSHCPFTCRMQKIYLTSRGSAISQFKLPIASNFIDVNRKMLYKICYGAKRVQFGRVRDVTLCYWARNCWCFEGLHWLHHGVAFQNTCVCSNTAVRTSNLTAWSFVNVIALYHSSYWCGWKWKDCLPDLYIDGRVVLNCALKTVYGFLDWICVDDCTDKWLCVMNTVIICGGVLLRE